MWWLAAYAGAQLYGAYTTSKRAKRAAQQARYEAEMRAQMHQREVEQFASEQESAFLNSGVTLEGSPLLVLKQTRERGAADVANIRAGGQSQSNQLKRQGRDALLGGVIDAGFTFAKGASKLSSAPKTEGDNFGRMYTGSFNDIPGYGDVA